MAVHSICPARYQTNKSIDQANFCLIVVGLFGNRFSFSCAHFPWDVVGSFLGLRSGKNISTITVAWRLSLAV